MRSAGCAVWVFSLSGRMSAYGGSSEALQLLTGSNRGFILSMATICPTANSSTSDLIETTTKKMGVHVAPPARCSPCFPRLLRQNYIRCAALLV